MRIASAQLDVTVGDLAGNTDAIIHYIARARERQADLVLFPELAITGYPPEDLLLKPKFIRDNRVQLERCAEAVRDLTAVVGFVDQDERGIYNAAAVLRGGKIDRIYRKMVLPNYGVFDEKRYFKPGTLPLVFDVAGVPVGINICEDIWHEGGPAAIQCASGAKVIAVINASPYHTGKVAERERILIRRARDHGAFLAYTNLVGGQDELVFDGYSMIVDPSGKVIAQAEGFAENLLIADIPRGSAAPKPLSEPLCAPRFEPDEEVYQALVLGLKDYVRKNGFSDVVIGISGGIDSAIVAALAVDALGKDKVHGLFMPTQYSSRESREDSEMLSKNLGFDLRTVPIEGLFQGYLKTLEPFFAGRAPDITEENLQARIRGNITMAFSNKFSWLVLTTGNKSEMSTGYATLYGDMAGGFAVIKDVPKMLVYRLARCRNRSVPVIPHTIIDKEPTAELRLNQKDSDSLPVYPILDPVLKMYVEEDREAKEIIDAGFNPAAVYQVINLVDKSEYKRRQAPPGIKITPRAFGRDRRMPITSKFTERVPKA